MIKTLLVDGGMLRHIYIKIAI